MNPADGTAGPKPFVFVLMPFKPEFEEVYRQGIKPVAAELGAHAERVDDQHHDDDILDRIINQIAKAEVIVADMTGKNPNVYYEVGYAHALKKVVVLLTQNTKDIPFDLAHRPHIEYSGVPQLKARLLPRLGWAIEQAKQGKTENVLSPIELYINNIPIANKPGAVTQVQDMGAHGLRTLSVQVKNISGASIKEPITHVYLLLPREAIVIPWHHGTGPILPMFWENPPIDGRFAQRFQLPIREMRLPAYAMESFSFALQVKQGDFPRVYILPALLEVLIADTIVRFRFDILFTGTSE